MLCKTCEMFFNTFEIQYANKVLEPYLKSKKLVKNIDSAKGNPYDNAVIESFHAILKKEEAYRKVYRSFEEARKELFK